MLQFFKEEKEGGNQAIVSQMMGAIAYIPEYSRKKQYGSTEGKTIPYFELFDTKSLDDLW